MERTTQVREDGQPAPDHSPYAESLVGLYAFGVLDGVELIRFERHLAGCGLCAGLVARDRELVATLSLAAPEVEAAPGFKERLLARAAGDLPAGHQPVGASGGSSGAAEPTPLATEPARLAAARVRRVGPVPLSWLAPLAAILLALLVGSGLLSREIASSQIVAVAQLDNQASGGRADVLVRRSGEGAIQLSGFEDLAGGRVYQAWVIRPGSAPVAMGSHASGNENLTLDGDVRGATVAVTLEPRPGATVPSVQPFLVGTAPA